MPLVSKFRRCVLLNLARMQCDAGDAKARIIRDLDGIEFGGVELTRNRVQSTCRSAMDRVFRYQPEAPSGARTWHVHGMPAGPANHRIENRSRDLIHKHPAIAKGLPERIDAVRQGASRAQKNGMQLHACAFFDVSGPWASVAPVELTVRVAGTSAIVCSPE